MVKKKHLFYLVFLLSNFLMYGQDFYESKIKLIEEHIYSKEQFGIDYQSSIKKDTFSAVIGNDGAFISSIDLIGQNENKTFNKLKTVIKNQKQYALKNHLKNVITTVTDLKIGNDENNDNQVDNYATTITSVKDYYPYGMLMQGRTKGGNYRMGFQEQEQDDEIKGSGNAINYKYRMYAPRIARFFAEDPLSDKYPALSTYQFSSNNPIGMIEIKGLEGEKVNETPNQTATENNTADKTPVTPITEGNTPLSKEAPSGLSQDVIDKFNQQLKAELQLPPTTFPNKNGSIPDLIKFGIGPPGVKDGLKKTGMNLLTGNKATGTTGLLAQDTKAKQFMLAFSAPTLLSIASFSLMNDDARSRIWNTLGKKVKLPAFFLKFKSLDRKGFKTSLSLSIDTSFDAPKMLQSSFAPSNAFSLDLKLVPKVSTKKSRTQLLKQTKEKFEY